MNRLKAMSVHEIVHRCRRLVQYFYDSARFRAGWMDKSDGCVESAKLNLFEPVNVNTVDSASTFNAAGPQSKFAVAAVGLNHLEQHRAHWLTNTVPLFDASSQYHLGNPVQWLTDPKTGVQTPRRFGRSIDYRDDRTVGEIKYLWEVGRHQFLVPMAVRVAFEKDDEVRATLETHLSSWLQQNPIGMGIHWCSALELGLRLISWSLIHGLLQSGGMKNGLFALKIDIPLLKAHIYAQVSFIAENYSRYSSSNNHLIGELTGVWVACNVFDLDAKGDTWRQAAFAELEVEADLQTHDDGVNKEQAIYYHLWSLEYFWLAWSVAKRYQRPVSSGYEERLVKMYLFLDAMCSSTQDPSQIGDADGGVVARFSPAVDDNAFRALLTPLSHILNGNNVKESVELLASSTAGLYSKTYWYQHLVAHSDVSSLVTLYQGKRGQSGATDTFEYGGYYVLQGDSSRLLFKAGPFGYLATAAHSHADALSVTLAIDEHWWLVDPGTYTYHSSGEWRNYFRSTAAHNTLSVNRTDQSEMTGDFLWSKKTDAKVHAVKRSSLASDLTDKVTREFLSQVSGTHSGYADQGVRHERTVTCDGLRTYELQDLVTLEPDANECEVQLAFHLHPSITLQQLDTHRWLATRQDSALALTIKLPEQFDWQLRNGDVKPIAGWYSETYGVKAPSNSLIGNAVLSHTASAEHNLYRTFLLVHEIDGTAASDGVAK